MNITVIDLASLKGFHVIVLLCVKCVKVGYLNLCICEPMLCPRLFSVFFRWSETPPHYSLLISGTCFEALRAPGTSTHPPPRHQLPTLIVFVIYGLSFLCNECYTLAALIVVWILCCFPRVRVVTVLLFSKKT